MALPLEALLQVEQEQQLVLPLASQWLGRTNHPLAFQPVASPLAASEPAA